MKRAVCWEWILVVIRNSSLPKLVKGFHLQGYEVLAGEMARACQLKIRFKNIVGLVFFAFFFFFLIIYIESFLWTAIPLIFCFLKTCLLTMSARSGHCSFFSHCLPEALKYLGLCWGIWGRESCPMRAGEVLVNWKGVADHSLSSVEQNLCFLWCTAVDVSSFKAQ